MKTFLLMFLVSLASLPDQSKAQMSCPDNWTEIDGKCYRVFTLSKTCSEAKTHCSNMEVTCDGQDTTGHLATVPDRKTQKMLHELVKNTITEENGWAFIGLEYDTTREADTWTDELRVDRTFWTKHEPCNEEPGTCAAITLDNKRLKNWVAKTEGTRGNHICMLPCIAEING